MKTILFLCCLILLTVSNVFSQQRDRGTFEVIPTIGFAGSDLYGSEVDQLIYRYGFRTGVLSDYYFNDRWSLRSGLTYFSMGADENIEVI